MRRHAMLYIIVLFHDNEKNQLLCEHNITFLYTFVTCYANLHDENPLACSLPAASTVCSGYGTG